MLVLAVGLAVVLVLSAATRRIDNAVYDGLTRWTSRTPHPAVILVTIDDQSLQQIGAWPWPRSVHAAVIDQLSKAGARAIAYDVLFVDAAADPAQDQALHAAIARAGDLCLPVAIERPGANGQRFELRLPVGAAQARLGHVDLAYDSDGVARRALLFQTDGARRIPHLTVCASQVGGGARPPQPPLPDSGHGRQLRAGDSVLIPYAKPAAFPAVPAVSVLRGEVPAAFFKDKYVLVGATAVGMRDRFATPATPRGEAMAGVEVQANLLSALLSRDTLRDAPAWMEIAFAVTGVALLMLALTRISPRRALPLAFGLLVISFAVSTAAFVFARIWLPPFPLIITAMLIFPLWGWRRLEAVSAYMLAELQSFTEEPELLPISPEREARGDTVEQQIQLLHLTIEWVRDLRRFAADTLQSLPDPTFVVGLGGEVLFANPPARALAKLDGAGPHDLAALAHGWRDADGAPLAAFQFDVRTEGWEREVVSPDGRPYLSATAPYRDAQGSLAAWIVRLTDITALKAAEAQREQIVQLLSHDLRSPQSSILALLETSPTGAIDPALAAQLAAYARKTLRLAGDFVQLARATSDALEFELLDLSDVVTEAIDDLWPIARRAQVRLTAEGCETEHLIKAERQILTRAVINLLDNAVKYSPGGSVVTCTLATEGERVRLDVTDQGVGMPADQLDSLSTPFRRLSTGRAAQGIGLGLTLVWEVVRRHDASIDVVSQVGEGSTFTLRFPLAEDPA